MLKSSEEGRTSKEGTGEIQALGRVFSCGSREVEKFGISECHLWDVVALWAIIVLYNAEDRVGVPC